MLEESKKSESWDRKQLGPWFSPINSAVFIATVQKISIGLFKRTILFSLAARKDCLLPWKVLRLDCMLVGINTIRWGRKGVIRELCIMAVRLAPRSGSGCEYLSWKRLFWERTNSGWKVGAWERRKSFTRCLQDCLPPFVARSPRLTRAVVSSDGAKIRPPAECTGTASPKTVGSRICTWQLMAINIHWVSSECAVLMGALGAGERWKGRIQWWKPHTSSGATYLPSGAVEKGWIHTKGELWMQAVRGTKS